MNSSAPHSDCSPPSRCWAEIDLGALVHNAVACREVAASGCGPGEEAPELMAVVKADAYGHGLERVVGALRGAGVRWFGVANAGEALRAREAVDGMAARTHKNHKGDEIRILLLGPGLPGERRVAVEKGFDLSVSNRAELKDCARLAGEAGRAARVHLVVDTGMGRMGCAPEELSALREACRALPEIELAGVGTHFPSADEDGEFTAGQIESFRGLVRNWPEEEPTPLLHLANSAGLLAFPQGNALASLVRPGLALYGVSPVAEGSDKLRSVLQWKTRITLVRDLPAGASVSYGREHVCERPTVAATLGAGYGDGYPRRLSGRSAEVLVGGRRCPLLGRVTMDQIVVDVSALENRPVPGDEAVLLGEQGNAEPVTAAELAEKAGTIPWEIFTGITARVERRYE